MILYCPRCNQRIMVADNTVDFVHNCDSGNPTLDQEDVLIVGNWNDGDVSGTKPAQEVITAGMENQLQGRRPQIEDNLKKVDLTRRGNIASTHRQRQHQEFININKKGLD